MSIEAPAIIPDEEAVADRRDELGSDYPDCRQSRHLHEDRLRQPDRHRLPRDVIDFPRLQHLHERQGPARRSFHHQPHLRHLRRQSRDLFRLRAEHGLWHQTAAAIAEWITNLGEAAEYMFDHNIFQDNLVGVDFCEKMVRETNPSVWERARTTAAPACGRARLPHHRRHHDVAQSIYRRSSTARRSRSAATRARCSA